MIFYNVHYMFLTGNNIIGYIILSISMLFCFIMCTLRNYYIVLLILFSPYYALIYLLYTCKLKYTIKRSSYRIHGSEKRKCNICSVWYYTKLFVTLINKSLYGFFCSYFDVFYNISLCFFINFVLKVFIFMYIHT